jgi:Clp amino terminal domain, pathogenicity island component
MQTAAEEARRRNERRVETEHILLGLVAENGGVVATVLRNLGVHPATIALRLETGVPWKSDEPIQGRPPLSRAAKNVVEFAIEEARSMGHTYVGTEHLLLGLTREETGMAAEILIDLGLAIEMLRNEVERVLINSAQTKTLSPSVNSQSNALNEAEREFFLSLYRSAVAYYKPKIEQRTGIQLGNISVLDYSVLYQHKIEEYTEKVKPGMRGLIKSLLFRRSLRRYRERAASAYAKRSHELSASYYRNAIYVSFESGTPHEEAVALLAVHELSHALWERIAGEPIDQQWAIAARTNAEELEKYNLFIEGFATYAERVWFRDFYPSSMKHILDTWRLKTGSVYLRGCRKIEMLVDKLGTEILLKIPKQWRELETADGCPDENKRDG